MVAISLIAVMFKSSLQLGVKKTWNQSTHGHSRPCSYIKKLQNIKPDSTGLDVFYLDTFFTQNADTQPNRKQLLYFNIFDNLLMSSLFVISFELHIWKE
jgi:hypothetical protein